MRALLILLALAGCSQVDPFTREDMWQPTGVNALNTAAMVANPHDLIRGHGEPGANGVQSTTAVDHLLAGTAKPLPSLDADAAPGAGSSSGSGGGVGGAAAAIGAK